MSKLKGNTACLNRVLDANIEGYRAIERAGHAILPASDMDYESIAYRKTCLRFFRLMCATGLGKLCASDHAMNAVDEMDALNRDMKAFCLGDVQETAVHSAGNCTNTACNQGE